MLRLLHFSDIHCFAGSLDRRGFFDKRLLGYLNTKLFREKEFDFRRLKKFTEVVRFLSPDVIIFSGDMTTNGCTRELEIAGNYLTEIRDATPADFIVIPGNHDTYVKDATNDQIRLKLLQALNKNSVSFEKRLAHLSYGKMHIYRMDAALATPFWCSGGLLEQSICDEFEQLLSMPREDKELRISICHFPCRSPRGEEIGFRRKLRGGEVIYRALNQGQLDIALCGHIHQPFLCNYKHSSGSGIEISAGSLTKHGIFNRIDFDERSGEYVQCWESVDGEQLIGQSINRFDLKRVWRNVTSSPSFCCHPFEEIKR